MAIKKELWDRARALFEIGKSLGDIQDDTGIPKSTVSKKAKKEGWEKGKNQPLKDALVEHEEKKATLKEEKSTLVEKASKLSDFEITILEEVVEDETAKKNLVASTATMALIRSNQQLTRGKKTAMTKVKTYDSKGNVNGETIELFEIELEPRDLKDHVELIDKASVTLKVNDRHAPKTTINNNNAQQTNIEAPEIEGYEVEVITPEEVEEIKARNQAEGEEE